MLSRPARAQVSGDFAFEDATFTPDDNALHALWATASGSWSYSGLETEAAEWRAYLLVDDQQNSGQWEAIGLTQGSASGTQGSGTYAIRGEITAASHYDSIDVSDGSVVTLTIPVSVLLMVMDGSGNTLATAEAVDTPTVTVEPGGSVSEVSGSGQIEAQGDAGDPTPTVPGA